MSGQSRLKGNNQEPIQSNSTSFPRYHAGKNPQNHHSIKSNSTSGNLRGQLPPSRCPPGHPKQNQQIFRLTGSEHTITIRINHNRSTALERSVINYWGWGLNRFHALATLALVSAVVHKHTLRATISYHQSGSHIGYIGISQISNQLCEYDGLVIGTTFQANNSQISVLLPLQQRSCKNGQI